MRMHLDVSQVQEAGCKALHQLSSGNIANQMHMRAAGAATAVGAALLAYPGINKIQEYGQLLLDRFADVDTRAIPEAEESATLGMSIYDTFSGVKRLSIDY